jgi:acyl carrier protein
MRMNDEQIRAGVLATLLDIAPETADEPLAPDRALRDQVDLDSMDWLNVIVGLHHRFGVDIPEAHYAKLVTLDGIVSYLATRLQDGPR